MGRAGDRLKGWLVELEAWVWIIVLMIATWAIGWVMDASTRR